MGSGSGGSYSVGTSGSQPYATATNIEENINDDCIYFKNTDKKPTVH